MGALCSTDDAEPAGEEAVPLVSARGRSASHDAADGAREPFPSLFALALEGVGARLGELREQTEGAAACSLGADRELCGFFAHDDLPEALVERVFAHLVERRLLSRANLHVFSLCRLTSLSLAGYPRVEDDWLAVLLRAHSDADRVAVGAPPPSPPPPRTLELASADGPTSSGGRLRRSLSMQHALLHFDVSDCTALTDEALACLRYCFDLRVVALRNCYRVTDGGVRRVLRGRDALEVLELSGCHQLTDETLRELRDKAALTRLSLDGCLKISDAGLSAALQHVTRLRVLDVSFCPQLSAAALVPALERLGGELEELLLASARLASPDVARLFAPGAFPALRRLSLANTDINDAAARALANLRALRDLDVSRTRCRQLALLPPLLRALDASFVPASKHQLLACAERLRALEVLRLEACAVDDEVLAALAQTPTLRELTLADTLVTSAGLAHLRALPLRVLNLNCCAVSPAGAESVARVETLEELHLDVLDAGDELVARLAALPRLRALHVFSAKITDAGAAALARVRTLETLETCGGRLTNAGVAHLATLPALRSLNVSMNRRVTDKGLATLARLRSLRHLNVSRTSVTHKGVLALRALPRMQSVSVFGCEQLREPSPKLGTLPDTLHIATDAGDVSSGRLQPLYDTVA